ncbi:MAG: hypothetical protein JSW00_18675 [Thermoplasmata archaeon]|nr:MAG: hypothetical protein JSW00_18675 [Thermoplasmata archaeon]
MKTKVRKMVAGTSILRTIYYSIIGKLRFPKKYIGKTVRMEDGSNYKIFRHMKAKRKKKLSTGAIFIVRFKFKKSDHKSNMRKSKIPIPMIAGFPGFREKLWMIDYGTDYWQGMYQFDNTSEIEDYKKSFVLGLMNKRAVRSTISYRTIPYLNLEGFLNGIMTD